MEDDRILERERRQIEQIRELDSEELQIEEVEGLPDSSDDEPGAIGVSSSDEFTFNTSLASLHSYLGEVDDTHNRLAFFDGGSILNIPLFYLEGVVLFPGSTLPLRVVQPNFIAAIEKAVTQVDTPYAIGVVRVYQDPDDGFIRFATIGTTAEIRQYRKLEDGSINVVTRGQQRFHLRRRWIDVEGAPCGEVQIIQEDLPLRTPRDAVGKLAPISHQQTTKVSSSNALSFGFRDGENDSNSDSEDSFEKNLSPRERSIHQAVMDVCDEYDRMGESTNSDEDGLLSAPDCQMRRSHTHDSGFIGSSNSEHEKKRGNSAVKSGSNSILRERLGREKSLGYGRLNKLRNAPNAFWPFWVYRMYDSYCLAKRAADMWKQIVGAPSMDSLVMKPDLLSFHIASKIPLSESTRQQLLEINGISYRLRREIELLEKFDCVRCKNCQSVIARRSDMLVMSSDGPLGAYVNPYGYVHEIMTFYKANGLALRGRPVKRYSWFPGYAWTNIECLCCETQMGWLFTATKQKLKPRSFWGIRSAQVAEDVH